MSTSQGGSAANYVVITPVRDEATHVGQTIASMLNQVRPPLQWVIVDDGSTDGTATLLDQLADRIDWVKVIHRQGKRKPALGAQVVDSFNAGFAALDHADWEFVVKLDGDVQFEANYFDEILARMASDPDWGIASGVYREQQDGGWRTIVLPPYHASGQSKVLRRRCYEDIGGFTAQKGWDTVDEIRAGRRGWKTGHFKDLVVTHLKPEGITAGKLKTHRFHGEIYYLTGGGVLFLIFKILHRMLTGKPRVLGGIMMAWGYFNLFASQAERLVTADEAAFYRQLLHARMLDALKASALGKPLGWIKTLLPLAGSAGRS